MNWQQFLEDNHIPYVTRGPNTKKGELSVKCPYCGDDDPSEHMGISQTSENWGCLRNRAHSGHNPATLIYHLMGCSWRDAKLAAVQYSKVDPDDLEGALQALEATGEPLMADEGLPEQLPVTQPIGMKRLNSYGGGDSYAALDGRGDRFWDYLANRGYDDVYKLCRLYNITCCTTGRFKDRIIIPFYRNGEMIAWSGRSIINPRCAPRYLSSNLIKTVVFNERELQAGGYILYITEGPFDALKVDFYGRSIGVRATCTNGVNVSVPQLIILAGLVKRFQKTKVLFDTDAIPQAWALAEWLGAEVEVHHLARYLKDPAEMSRHQVADLAYHFKRS